LLALPLLAGALRLTAHLGQRADDAYHHHFAQTSQRLVEFAQAQSVLRAFNGDGDGGGTRFLQQAIDAQRHAGTRLIYLSALASVLNAWVVQAIFAALLAAAALGCRACWVRHPPRAIPSPSSLHCCWWCASSIRCRKWPAMAKCCAARGPLDAARDIFAVQPCRNGQAPHGGAVELRDVHFRYAQEQPTY
jgi:ATP-binding cassette subfamily B protein